MFSTIALIRLVQKAHIEILELLSAQPDKKGGGKKETAAITRRRQELTGVRYHLIRRLELMDRASPDFFPPDCYVKYRNPESGYPERFAKITGRTDTGDLIIKVEGETEHWRVPTLHCKLAYISNEN